MQTRRIFLAGMTVATLTGCTPPQDGRSDLDARVNFALGQMWARVPVTRTLSARAVAMLVMPASTDQTRSAALLHNTEQDGYEAPAAGYYRTTLSPTGAPAANHVVFFMGVDRLTAFEATPEGGIASTIVSRVSDSRSLPARTGSSGLIAVSFSDLGLSPEQPWQRLDYQRVPPNRGSP